MKKMTPTIEAYGDAEAPAFGNEMLRQVLIPELLGDDIEPILYWAGRKLARQYPCDSLEAIKHFFNKSAWGTLELKEDGKKKIQYELSSDFVTSRLKNNPSTVFSLEGGFLAEQIQQLKGYVAEVQTEIKKGRTKKVLFEVMWDTKDKI